MSKSFTPRSRPTPDTSEPPCPTKVTGSLSYLDNVKRQFQDKPEVYNRFLDILEDFKNEVVDPPSVIDRVSTLFHGHPTLIEGFNTFLPPGYRIGICSDPNVIRVTTPAGTTTQSTQPRPTASAPNPSRIITPYLHQDSVFQALSSTTAPTSAGGRNTKNTARESKRAK